MSTIDPLATVRVPTAAREKLGLPPSVAKDEPTYGTVYGRSEPPAEVTVPNVDGMLDAIGVPRSQDGLLPFTKEWYANAKQRQRTRNREQYKLFRTLNGLRLDFAESMQAELRDWSSITHELISTQDTPDIELLLSQTTTERPWDIQERDAVLIEQLKAVEGRHAGLQQGLMAVSERFPVSEKTVLENEAHDRDVEEARAKTLAAEHARYRAAELAVAQATALLKGEEPPSRLDSDDEDELPTTHSTPPTADSRAETPAVVTAAASPPPRRQSVGDLPLTKDGRSQSKVHETPEAPIDVSIPKVDEKPDDPDVPSSKDGLVPFTKEWYANAKQRQQAREKERAQLFSKLDGLRLEFADLMQAELHHWGSTTDAFVATQDTLDVEYLLAEASAERKWSVEEHNALIEHLDAEKARPEGWQHGVVPLSDRFIMAEETIVGREIPRIEGLYSRWKRWCDRAIDQIREEALAAEHERYKAAELALTSIVQATAILHSEEPPMSDLPDEVESTEGTTEGSAPTDTEGRPDSREDVAIPHDEELPAAFDLDDEVEPGLDAEGNAPPDGTPEETAEADKPDSSQDLDPETQLLLAQAPKEQHWAIKEHNALVGQLKTVEGRRTGLQSGLMDVSGRFAVSEKTIMEREARDRAIEQARTETLAAERARYKAAELAVAQALALLKGEKPPTKLDSDDEDESPSNRSAPPKVASCAETPAIVAAPAAPLPPRRSTRDLPPLKDPPAPPPLQSMGLELRPPSGGHPAPQEPSS